MLFLAMVAGCSERNGSEDGIEQSKAAIGLDRAPETHRLRVLTWNVWGVPGVEEERAKAQAKRIREHADGFDVILLNEVFGDGYHVWNMDMGTRDRFYDILKDEFPYVIYKTFSSQQVDFANSGLMAFSRFPFVPATNDGDSLPTHKANVLAFMPGKTMNPDVYGPYIRFLEFDHSCNTDQWAAKGVALFHIQPPGGKRYNIAFTHMNAGSEQCAIAARIAQVGFIRTLLRDRISTGVPSETIVAGDMNIDGWVDPTVGSAESPGTELRTDEYRSGVWGHLNWLTPGPDLPFFDAWRTTSPLDDGVTNNLGEGEGGFDRPENYFGNHRLDYFLVNGTGYHTPGAQTWTNNTSFASAPNDPRCVNWIRTTLKSTTSDHYGVAMELGPRSTACNPALAQEPRNLEGRPSPYQLSEPGSDRWFKVPAGTYTFGLGRYEMEEGLTLEVFSARNLSRGVRPLEGYGLRNFIPDEDCDGTHGPCKFTTNRYFGGTDDLYVRVFSPDGRTFGTFHLLALKHDCSSEATACELLPGNTLTPSLPTDREFKGFFTYRSIATVNPAVPQTATIETAVTSADGKISVGLIREGSSLAPLSNRRVATYTRSEAQSARYLLEVARTANDVTYSVRLETNLTVVTGAKDDMVIPGHPMLEPPIGLKLICLDESGANLAGEEEIGVEVWADGVLVAGPPTLFRPDLDADEAMDMSSVPMFGFVNEAHLKIREHSGDLHTDPVDDYGELDLPKMRPSTSRGERRQQNVTLHNVLFPQSNGPLLQFQYFASHGGPQ